MNIDDKNNYDICPEARDIDGVYVQVVRKGNKIFRCFSDLSINEQKSFIEKLDKGGLERLCLLMTHTLRDIADSLNLYGNTAVNEDKVVCSYKPLWKLLIDKGIRKSDFIKKAEISQYTITQMNKGKKIQPIVVERICTTLGCTPKDIMEFEAME